MALFSSLDTIDKLVTEIMGMTSYFIAGIQCVQDIPASVTKDLIWYVTLALNSAKLFPNYFARTSVKTRSVYSFHFTHSYKTYLHVIKYDSKNRRQV